MTRKFVVLAAAVAALAFTCASRRRRSNASTINPTHRRRAISGVGARLDRGVLRINQFDWNGWNDAHAGMTALGAWRLTTVGCVGAVADRRDRRCSIAR